MKTALLFILITFTVYAADTVTDKTAEHAEPQAEVQTDTQAGSADDKEDKYYYSCCG